MISKWPRYAFVFSILQDIEVHDFFPLLLHKGCVFSWQHEFIVHKLMSTNKHLCLKYVSLHGRKMQNVQEIIEKMGIFVTNARVCEGYKILVCSKTVLWIGFFYL